MTCILVEHTQRLTTMITVGFIQPNSLFSFSTKSIDKTQPSRTKWVSSSSSSFSSHSSVETFHRTGNVQVLQKDVLCGNNEEIRKKNKRVFFLDVSPLCYEGNKPSSQAFGHWISLFFSQVSLTDPVIAVKISPFL